MSARVAAAAGRLRMTEGQLYSALITLGMAALLATGLGNVHGVASSVLDQPPLALATPPPPAVVVPSPVPAGTAPPLGLPSVGGPAPVPAPAPGEDPQLPQSPPLSGPTVKASPPQQPCDKQAVQDAGKTVITTANKLAGGRLPEKDLLAALGTVTGCDPTDPALLAVGILVGLGETLPDPGLPAPPPLLPFVQVPAAVVQALQPVRPEIDTVCGLVGTGSEVGSLFVWAYPTPIPQLEAQAMFAALSACGEVRQP